MGPRAPPLASRWQNPRRRRSLNMHRRPDNAPSVAAAAVKLVKPLQELARAAKQAADIGRTTRALELYERAVAAAEAALPCDSLVIAALLSDTLDCQRVGQHMAAEARAGIAELERATWRSDEQLASMSRKALMLCDARFRAGTLFTPTPAERAYHSYEVIPTPLCGAFAYFLRATEALFSSWSLPAADDDCARLLHAVHGALRAAVELDARGFLDRHPDTGQPWAQIEDGTFVRHSLSSLLHALLRAASHNTDAGQRMQSMCVVSGADVAALRQLEERLQATEADSYMAQFADDARTIRHNSAADDMERFGLRACALPECDAVEPHPKAFKVCSRCRAVCYCSSAHQQQDWRRHKRADSCKAAT